MDSKGAEVDTIEEDVETEPGKDDVEILRSVVLTTEVNGSEDVVTKVYPERVVDGTDEFEKTDLQGFLEREVAFLLLE